MVIALVWSNWGPKSSAVRRAQFWSRLYIFSTRGPKFGPASRTQIWYRQLTQVCYCSRPNSWTYLCLNTTNNASQSNLLPLLFHTHQLLRLQRPIPQAPPLPEASQPLLAVLLAQSQTSAPVFLEAHIHEYIGEALPPLGLDSVQHHDWCSGLRSTHAACVPSHIYASTKGRKTQSLSPGPPLAPPVQTDNGADRRASSTSLSKVFVISGFLQEIFRRHPEPSMKSTATLVVWSPAKRYTIIHKLLLAWHLNVVNCVWPLAFGGRLAALASPYRCVCTWRFVAKPVLRKK